MKFDPVVRGALDIAQTEALTRQNNHLTTNHLLMGFLKNPNSIISERLAAEHRDLVAGILDQLPKISGIKLEDIRPDNTLTEWYSLASSRATEQGREQMIEADFIAFLGKFFPQIKIDDSDLEEQSEVPDFLSNLNELAALGKLDPVIGRSQEIRRVQEILCRRTKNNPVITGSPGVGKTAIVEGLAGLIIAGQVPDIIRERTIYSMNMGSLMSGTKYRGEFEEKIQALLQFLKREGRSAILFIDEIHLLIGAGKTDGAMDAANLLKPALARGELNCIGATTPAEYKQYIESDAALERRFHRVVVEEPSTEDTIQILLGIKEKLEIHHGIEITDQAIVQATQLSKKYIADRFLPDKAIDVIDEAAAGIKISADSIPPEMQELEALIKSKKILASAKIGEPDANLIQDIESLEQRHALLKQEYDATSAKLRQAAAIKKQVDDAQFQLQKAENEGNFEAASRIKYGLIPELSRQLEGIDVDWKLTSQHVAEVIARNTGIPLGRILESGQEHMLRLEAELKDKVFGQDHALQQIAECLLSSYAGLTNQNRPLGSFLLTGPSGVGKTETAKVIADHLFHSRQNLISIDLSEYSEAHAISKLIGAPPGYVGYEKGGILTEAVRRKPYSVVLFDEAEKAHPDFTHILLQLLDEGRLTDSQGRMVTFVHTVVFITSNAIDYRQAFKPEVIGRLDAVLTYNELSTDAINLLIDRELQRLNQTLSTRKIAIRLDPSIIAQIAALGFDPRYGARPLKNAFNTLVIRPLSRVLLAQNDLKDRLELSYSKQDGVQMRSIA